MDCVLNRNFYEMNVAELEMIEGGSFWGVVGGVALLVAPDPTTVTKFAGGSAIALGVGSVIGGVVQIASNF